MPASFGPGGGSSGGGGGGVAWGAITGTLSDQTDLGVALAAKAGSGANSDITSMSGLTTSNAISTPKTINMGDGTGTAQITFDNGTVSRNHAFQIKAVNNSDTQYFGFDGGQNAWFMFDSGTNVNYRFASTQLECGANVLKIFNDTDVNMDVGSATKRMKNVYVARGVVEARFDAGNSSTAIALDWNNGNQQKVTMTGAAAFTLNNPVTGVTYKLWLFADATGNYVPTWPAAVKWPSGVAPILSGPNKLDRVNLEWDGTDYIGSFSGNYTP